VEQNIQVDQLQLLTLMVQPIMHWAKATIFTSILVENTAGWGYPVHEGTNILCVIKMGY
jgi:hypothetical protein